MKKMKLAIIDHRAKEGNNRLINNIKNLILELYKRDVQADFAVSLSKFKGFYGSLNNYDGIILHSGTKDQKADIEEIVTKHPNLKLAFATYEFSRDELKEHYGIFNFEYSTPEEIVEYFSK